MIIHLQKIGFLSAFLLFTIPALAQRKLKTIKPTTTKTTTAIDTVLLAKKMLKDGDTSSVGVSKKKPLTVKALFEPNGRHSPRTAVVLSLVLPGAGQVYNRKWWKVPIIYAGLGSMAYFYQQNNTAYTRFKAEYIARVDKKVIDPSLGFYNVESLQTYRDYYRSNTEWSALGFIVVYMMNGVDAFVDGHLYSFKKDMKEDVGVRLQPTLQAQPDGSLAPTLGMSYALHQKSVSLRQPKLNVF